MQQTIKILTIILMLGAVASTANAQSSHMRLLMHGHKQVHESGLGLSGWVVAPSVTDAPDQWLMLAGPRYDGAGWNVELMGGAVMQTGEATPLVDARLELTPALLGAPFYIWANPEWIVTGKMGTVYGYLQVDYVLPEALALVGIETENVINNKTDLSVGPHIVIPMGKLALIGAYQFHSQGEDQLWTRMVINL